MAKNPHTEEITKETARLFEEAYKIEPESAHMTFHGSTGTEKEKQASLKLIISGEHRKRCDAGDASDKLRKILMRLRMLGDLLDISNDGQSPDEETAWVAGGLIWDWVKDAEKARGVLSDRWDDLEDSKLQNWRESYHD